MSATRVGLWLALLVCGCSSNETASGSNSGGSPGAGGASTPGGGAAQAGNTALGSGGAASQTSGGSSAAGAASAGTTSAAGSTSGICGAAEGQLFDASHPWNQKVSSAPLDSESNAIIQYLEKNHTASARFQIDGTSDEANNTYGLVLLRADASTPHRAFTPSDDFYEPDCDDAAPPMPSGGAIEGESGYACDGDGDCHLLVIDTAACRLYEMWRANATSSRFDGGCQAVWDLRAPYQPTLRGDCCTSADAAGLPIAAHTFTADEVAAGEIKHAIRFILPNQHMRARVYVRPATHSTSATSGPASAPPYGARMRLKASVDVSGLTPGARVVANALKEYGMILSDGGNLTFTAANDRFTTAKWRDVDLSARDLTGLHWSDFEVVELGTRYTFDSSCDCNRTPISE
jgi:serine/threonine-protein kinase